MEKIQFTDFEAHIKEIQPITLDLANHLFYCMNTMRVKANNKYTYLCRDSEGKWELHIYNYGFNYRHKEDYTSYVCIYHETCRENGYAELSFSVKDATVRGVFSFIDDVLTKEYENAIGNVARLSKVNGEWIFASGVKLDVDMGMDFEALRAELLGVLRGEIPAEVIQNPEIEPEILDVFDADAIEECDNIVTVLESHEIEYYQIDPSDLNKLAKAVVASRKEGNGPFARNSEGEWISENNGSVIYYDPWSTLCASSGRWIKFK